MLKTLTGILVAGLALTGTAMAQTTTPKEAEKPAVQSRPAEPARLMNVRIELTISDQTGPGEPSKKVVTMHVADRTNASIRTSGFVLTKDGRRDVSISVDARPTILTGREGSVQIDLGLSYIPTGSASGVDTGSAQTGLTERVIAILESGKPLIVSQAADPISDRRISVELRATILK